MPSVVGQGSMAKSALSPADFLGSGLVTISSPENAVPMRGGEAGEVSAGLTPPNVACALP